MHASEILKRLIPIRNVLQTLLHELQSVLSRLYDLCPSLHPNTHQTVVGLCNESGHSVPLGSLSLCEGVKFIRADDEVPSNFCLREPFVVSDGVSVLLDLGELRLVYRTNPRERAEVLASRALRTGQVHIGPGPFDVR
jgi:hypothetical protein